MGIRASWPGGPGQAAPVGANAGTVYTRCPRLLVLDFVRQVGNDVVVTDRRRQYVASAASAVVEYKLEKSWLGHRELSLTFDADGFVSSVSTEGTSISLPRSRQPSRSPRPSPAGWRAGRRSTLTCKRPGGRRSRPSSPGSRTKLTSGPSNSSPPKTRRPPPMPCGWPGCSSSSRYSTPKPRSAAPTRRSSRNWPGRLAGT